MSLILEALRKSEAERRRGKAPDLSAELPPPALPRRGRVPAWAGIAAALALLLLAAWWLRGSRPIAGGDVVAEAAPVVSDDTAEVTDATDDQEPRPSGDAFPRIERIAPPLPVRPEAVPPAPAAAAPSPPATVAMPSDPAAAPRPAPGMPLAARPPPAPARDAPIPTVAELPAEERRLLPAMKLSMHLWNERPAQRFVILDGIRYGEGDRIGTAVITGIDPDGVTLDLDGRAVRLPLR